MEYFQGNKEKIRYWEGRLEKLLHPIPIVDLLVTSWAIEATRNGKQEVVRKYLLVPGEPEEHQILGKYFILPWTIDGIVNERLLLGKENDNINRRLDLSNWNSIAKLVNTYQGLANVESVKDFKSKEIIAALQRLFWPQQNWQLGFVNAARLGRAWHLYVSSTSKKVFAARYSIEIEAFLKTAFAIYVATEDNPAVRASHIMQIGVTQEEIFRVGQIIGFDLDGHVKNAREIRDSKIPLDYRRSTVAERPLFVLRDKKGVCFLVPSRERLFLRITDGLYFDIVQDGDARRISGQKFEELCGRLLEYYGDPLWLTVPERPTSFGMSADYFVTSEESDLCLIVECKSRRIPQRILTSPDPWKTGESDFVDIIKGIVQIWRSHFELMSSKETRVAGLVVQFESWTVLGNSFLKLLFDRAHSMADNLGIPKISRVPVSLVGFSDFETCLRHYGLDQIYDAVIASENQDYRGYQLSVLLEKQKIPRKEKKGFDYVQLGKDAVSWLGEMPRPARNE